MPRRTGWALRAPIIAIAIGAGGPAAAQNAAGVFPPVVNEGASVAEYRATYGARDERDALVQRLHYQRAVSGDVMWRLVGQVGGPVGDQEAQLVQAELFWEVSDDGDDWRTGFRFDGTVRSGGPGQVAAAWTNEFPLGERWTARALVRGAVQLGDDAPDGIGLETRANLFTRTANGVMVGVESFNAHGSTNALDLFGGSQQLGPFAVWPVVDGWSVFTGVLFGATDASPDADLRLWLTRSF